MTEITVYYDDDTKESVSFVDKLYDLPWNEYKKLENTIKANADVDRDGEIQRLNLGQEDMGEFLVNFQEKMAKIVLESEDIQLADVKARTVKEIVQSYGDDMEELGLELKTKLTKIDSLIDLWSKGHSPEVDDRRIENAADWLVITDDFSVDMNDLPAIEGKFAKIMRAKIQKKQNMSVQDVSV